MKAGLLAIGLGGAAIIALVAWFGAHAIGAEVLSAGWALPPAIVLHALQLYLSAVAWRGVLGGGGPGLNRIFKIRWIRESVNSMLPVAQIGGNLVSIRLLVLNGFSGATATAGTTIDLTLEALTQLVFTLFGILVLATLGFGTDVQAAWTPWLNGSIGLTALGLAAFIAAQRFGMMRIVEAVAVRLQRLVPAVAADGVRGLHSELMRLQHNPAALLRGAGLHLFAWVLGIAETWLILWTMDVPVQLSHAAVIETLGMAARSAGFIVPGALGVQETGFILVCRVFGIPADTALALSMVKRARELSVGLPGLVAWQWTEAKQWLRRRSAQPVHFRK